jgi:hypothetical protein
VRDQLAGNFGHPRRKTEIESLGVCCGQDLSAKETIIIHADHANQIITTDSSEVWTINRPTQL